MKKVLIIVISIIVILILAFFVARFLIKMNIEQKEREIIQKTLIDSINQGLNQLNYENRSSTEIIDMKTRLDQGKSRIKNNFNDLKVKTITEIYYHYWIVECKLTEKTFELTPDIDSYKECNNSGYKVIQDNGYKKFNVSGDKAIIQLAAQSLLITLTERMIDKYEFIKDSKMNHNQLVGNMLTVLDLLSKIVSEWQIIQAPISNISQNNPSLLYTNSKKVIINLENYNNNFKYPSQEEINNLNLKNNCIKAFDKLGSKDQLFKISSPVLSKIFFIYLNKIEVCREFEKSQKDTAISIINRIPEEKNPIVAINNKVYLNIVIKCENEIFSSGFLSKSETPCIDNYTNKIKQELISELNNL